MTRFPSRTAVICARVNVLFSMTSEAWIVRIRLTLRNRGEREASTATE